MKTQKKSSLKLYLMRHAEAEDLASSKNLKDSERALTENGILTQRLVCQGLSRLKCKWDVILSSPYLRTKQSAAIVGELFDLAEHVETLKELAPGSSFQNFCKKLNQYLRNSSILIVGHEPLLSEWTSLLISGSSKSNLTFKKSAVACIHFEGKIDAGLGTLEFLMQPIQLQRLGKKRK